MSNRIGDVSIMEQAFNENFTNSLKKYKPQKELKDIVIEGKLIKNVPVLKNDRLFEDSVSSDTLDQIYRLISLNQQKEIIHYKEE